MRIHMSIQCSVSGQNNTASACVFPAIHLRRLGARACRLGCSTEGLSWVAAGFAGRDEDPVSDSSPSLLGRPLKRVPDDLARKVALQIAGEDNSDRHFAALLRILDREEPDYAS